MKQYLGSMYQELGAKRGGRAGNSLIAFGVVLVLFYLDSWYFAPTGPVARLPYCVREIFFRPLSEIDTSDGRISGMFATEPQNDIHFSNVYAVLQFSEDGSVADYSAADRYAPVVNAHRLAIRINWLETPSLSWADIPRISDDIRTGWNEGMDFALSPPEKGTYVADRDRLTIIWNAEQKWSSFNAGETWTGVLANETILVTQVFRDGRALERTYDYIDYDTCPLWSGAR